MGKSVLCAGSCLRLFDVCVWSMRAISKTKSTLGPLVITRGRAAVTRVSSAKDLHAPAFRPK